MYIVRNCYYLCRELKKPIEELARSLVPELGKNAKNERQVKALFNNYGDDGYVAMLINRMGKEPTKKNRKKYYDLATKQWKKLMQLSQQLYGDVAYDSHDEQEAIAGTNRTQRTPSRGSHADLPLRRAPFLLPITYAVLSKAYQRSSSARETIWDMAVRNAKIPNNCAAVLQREAYVNGENSCTMKRNKMQPEIGKLLRYYLRCSVSTKCFKMKITLPNPSDVAINHTSAFKCEWIQNVIHHKDLKTRQIRGDRRLLFRAEAPYEGGPKGLQTKTKAECQRGNIHRSQVPNIHALRKACADDPYATTIPESVDSLISYHKDVGITFIRENSIATSLRIVFGSDEQVKLFQRESNGVLYFDATGSVVLPSKEQRSLDAKKPIFLYSIVFQDPTGGMAIPVMEALLSSHTSNSISLYLDIVRMYLVELGKKTRGVRFVHPTRVVIDFSWANIHAVLRCLPGKPMHITDYLQKTYNKMINGRHINDDFVLSFCHSHVIKAWTKHSSIPKRRKSRARHIFIRAAVSLLVASGLEEARNRFRLLCQLALSKNYTEDAHGHIVRAFEDLAFDDVDGFECPKKNEEDKDEDFDDEDEEFLQAKEREAELDFHGNTEVASIRKESPFYQIFRDDYEEILSQSQLHEVYNNEDSDNSQEKKRKNGSSNNKKNKSESNEFYNPEFVQYLLFYWLSLFPLWNWDTKLTKEDGLHGITTNSLVERYFRSVKYRGGYKKFAHTQVQFLERQRKMLRDRCDAILLDLKELARKKSLKLKVPAKKPNFAYKQRKVLQESDEANHEQWRGKFKSNNFRFIPDPMPQELTPTKINDYPSKKRKSEIDSTKSFAPTTTTEIQSDHGDTIRGILHSALFDHTYCRQHTISPWMLSDDHQLKELKEINVFNSASTEAPTGNCNKNKIFHF